MMEQEKPETDEHQGVLQPHRTSSAVARGPEDEHQRSAQNSAETEEQPEDERLQDSDTAASSDKDMQLVSIDDAEGSPEKRLRYESADDAFARTAADDDDDDDDDDKRNNRYVLEPQEFSIHVGAEADLAFDALGNENRFIPQIHPEDHQQQEPPELLFEPDNDTDNVSADNGNNYIQQAEPSLPEADLDAEVEAPEPHFEPDFAAVRDSDRDENLQIRASQPFATEADLEATQESPELEFQPGVAGGHVNDGEENNGYNLQSQPFASEADVETAEEPPELQFESDDDENQYIQHSQPSAPEADLDARFPSQNLGQYGDDEGGGGDDGGNDDDDDVDESSRYIPESQRDDYDADGGPPELQFQAEDDKLDDLYFTQSQSSAQEADRDTGAVLHFADDEAAGFGDEYDDSVGDDDDGENRFTSHQDSPELESQQDHTLYVDVSHDGDDDDDDDGGGGGDYEERPYEETHSHSYESSVGANNDGHDEDADDDDIQYESKSDESEPVVGYSQMSHESQQQQSSYYEDEYDDDDHHHDYVIIGGSAGAEGVQGDEDNPRVLIKGILNEGDADEQYAENAYEEGNDDDEEGDADDVLDIRDNTNVEDQFIEFEESSFVQAAVGGIMGDAGMNGEKGSQGQNVDDELGAIGGTASGTDDGDRDEAESASKASTSRVRFADDGHPAHEHQNDHYPDGHGDADDYHIIPGASNQPSHDSRNYDHAETGEKSLDVLLLEEICEEAASMTIKEALIHSLKPNVRAGLTTAHLKLSESEVLALEEYCEDFVGGLIKDLLKRSNLMELASKTKTKQPVVKASVIKTTAKHLSAMEVQQMKVYCDHFVHNVIAESIIDSSMIVARRQHQAEEVKELLHMFQNSEELQEYFTNLTTDIVRTALLNVTAKDDIEEDIQESEQPTESAEHSRHPGERFEFEDEDDDFDFDGRHSFEMPEDGSPEYRRSSSQESWSSEDEDGVGTNVAGSNQRMAGKRNVRSPPGHTTLEFDEEWAEEVMRNIEPSADGEKRQKFFMRELEFDDRVNVGGTELLAPVFLAIAEENEDDAEFEGLRRKTQSIEDLCDLIEEEQEPPRKRASSLTQPKKKPRKKPRPTSFRDQLEELKKEAINEDISDAEPEEEQLPISPESPGCPKTSSEKPFYAYDDERYRWHTIRVNNREKVLDLKLIEPYMKVITHGGVHTPSRAVIVVIAGCYLPDKTRKNYDFLMEQLFFYLISTLELLATTDEYFLVYFNGGSTQSNQPALPWMKRFYQHVEGGLKKNMINMFIVHPNFWLKTVVRFAKAFVGTNFWSKLQFIKSLDELSTKIPVEFIYVPDEVIRSDPKYKRVHNL